MKATQRVPALQSGQLDDLAAGGILAIVFSCSGVSPSRKIAPNGLGIRGMSAEIAHRAPTVSAGQVAGCFALFVIAWTLYGTIAGAGKALHGDVAEAYAWGREFRLGYNQHPPLWAWVAGAWFLIFPHQDWAFQLLAMINAALGLLGCWYLIGLFADGWKRLAGFALLPLVPFHTFLAFKYNANTAFLSLWPWTLYAFVRTIDRRRPGDAVLFGVLAAASLMSKYFAAVLLATWIAGSLVHRERRAYYRSASPYLSAAICAVLVLPHVFWLATADAPPIEYVLSRTGIGVARALGYAGFLVLSIALYHIAVIGVLAVSVWQGAGAIAPARREDTSRFRFLAVIVAAPVVLTVLSGLMFELKTSALMMVGCFALLPLFLIEAMPPVDQRRLTRLAGIAAAVVTIGPLIASPAVAYAEFALSSDPTATEPRKELAQAVTDLWRRDFGTPLRIVGGSPAYDSVMAFYSPDRPSAFLSLDRRRAPWITPDRIAALGLVAVCVQADATCKSAALAFLSRGGRQETLVLRHEFWGMSQQEIAFDVFVIPPTTSGSR
jgi:hypothetical protein